MIPDSVFIRVSFYLAQFAMAGVDDLRIACSSFVKKMMHNHTGMKHSISLDTLIVTVVSVFVFSSCSTPTKIPSNSSFIFDPPAKQPTRAVAVHISTGAQRVYVTQGNEVLFATPCTVGTSAAPTPQGEFHILSKTRHRRRMSMPGAGYPMTYWMSFSGPAYGMHWGFVKPYPSTHGCVRLPLNSARKIFDMVQVGTPISVTSSKPWDATIGAELPRLDDSALPNPPDSYMLSPRVFSDAEKGKMWDF